VTRVATLEHLGSGREYVLTARHVVGRASTCQLRVMQPEVSGLHAELRWDGERWFVQDLGSRNGTFVGGTRISPGERAPVFEGSQIAFGDEGERYRVVEVRPPCLMALAPDGRSVLAEANLLCLPSDDNPEVTVFEDAQGRFMLDDADGSRLLGEREVIVVGDTSWTLYPPTASDRTQDIDGRPLPLESITLEFVVSRDEEYIGVSMSHDRGTEVLEPRAHAQLLLTLARLRLADCEREGLSESEHGWVHRDDLLEALGIDMQLLNLWVFRVRQQLIKTGVRDAGSIIERRSGTLQLRIGVSQLAVRGA